MPKVVTFERVLQMGQLLPLAKVFPQAQLLDCKITNQIE
jgi:hypothetical protein